MKRVLVLGYYFPPLGGVGPQRTVKILKHLPSLGYEPIVVTGPDGAEVEVAPADPVLAADVPVSTRVERIRTPPPSESLGWSRMRRLLGRWSPLEEWWQREATAVARSVVGEVDLVYASMSPFSTAGVAGRVAGEAGAPWIADLQDPWALDDWLIYPTALHRRIERRRMGKLLRSAAAVVMNTNEAARALRSRCPDVASSRIVSIPHGWDRDDFRSAAEPRSDGCFRIVYAGYSHVRRGREHRARRGRRELFGGAVRGMDILSRSHAFLVEAIARLADEDSELASRIEVHVAGAAPIDPAHDLHGVTIRHHGYLPHDRAVALMRSADLLFLAMHDLPVGVRATTVPGKTYEYLASGRPILAALPDGDARDLLAGSPNVSLCRPTDVECMTASLRRAVEAEHASPAVPADPLERFEWRRLSEELVGLFDRALSEVTS